MQCNASYLSDLLAALQHTYPYKCSQSLEYLGVNLTPIYSTLYTVNYPPLFREISCMLRQWDTDPILDLCWVWSIYWRCPFSQNSYNFFETLPVTIPMSHLQVLQQWFLSFIWHNKSHCIVRSIIFAFRTRGTWRCQVLLCYPPTHHCLLVKPIHSQ